MHASALVHVLFVKNLKNRLHKLLVKPYRIKNTKVIESGSVDLSCDAL